MKKIYFAIKISLIFIGYLNYAQVKDGIKTPTIIPPSPTVANLMNFEEVPIDFYTGQPDITVPIYTKSLNSELSLPIVLKYSTLGLRLEQRSGWLGTGWSLDCGGVISRTVRGYPDEAIGGAFYNQRGIFHNPDFWNYENLNDTEKNEFIWNSVQNSLDRYDGDPDLYQINIPGYTSRFVIVKEDDVFVVKQLDMNQKLKITFTMNSSKAITAFEVTDPNGYRYSFGGTTSAIETVKTLTTSVAQNFDPEGIDGAVYPVFMDDIPPVNSSWMLTTIKTSNLEPLAIFEYQNSTEVYNLPTSYTENSILQAFPNPSSWWVIAEDDDYNYSMLRMRESWVFREITAQTKKLTKIIFKDKTSLQFTLSAEDSHPETAGRYLTGISILEKIDNSDVLVRSYSVSQSVTSQGRLFLTSVSSGSEWENLFTYHDKENFDMENERFDGWGYTSGDYRDMAFNDYRTGAFKKGALQKITSKGNGVKEFIWEPHTFTFEGDKALSKFAPQVFDVNPNNSSPVTPAFSHLFNAAAINDTDTGSTITITHKQYIQVMKNILPTSTALHPEIFEVAFIKGGVQMFSIPVQDLPGLMLIEKGTYTVKVKIKTTLNTTHDGYLRGYINIFYTALKSEYQNWLLGGGLRIGAIKFYDKDIPLEPKRIFNYRYKMMANITPRAGELNVASSGAVDSKIGTMKREYETIEERYFYKLHRKVANDAQINYTTKTNTPNTQLTRGGYIGYKRVVMSEGIVLNGSNNATDLTDNGYTEYIYSSPIDEPAPMDVFQYPYLERPNLDLMRGLLKEKRTYNKDNVKLDETINTYNRIETPVITAYTIKPKPCKWLQFYKMQYSTYRDSIPTDLLICTHCGPYSNINCPQIDCFAWSGYSNCGPLAPFDMIASYINAGRAELTSTSYTQFFNSVPGVTKTTSYSYNPLNYRLTTQTDTFIEGSETITQKAEYQYPVGPYDNSNYFNTADVQTISDMVVQNIINKPIVINSYKNNEKINTTINVYKTFPMPQTVSSTSNPPGTIIPDPILLYKVKTLKGGIPNASPEDRLIYHAYNSIGNVTDVSMAGGLRTCYIWGYEGTLPVVKIDNVPGGYTNLDTNKVAAIQTASNNGLPNSLDNPFNELRTIYTNQLLTGLKPSLVTTVKHHPVHGVLEIIDPKALKTTFGYDYLGRLLWVKDTDGNLLNEYKYHFPRF